MVAIIGLTSAGGIESALLVLLGGIVVLTIVGVLPWLTTSYRVTATHLEVRSGLINRKTLTARLDRSAASTSSPR